MRIRLMLVGTICRFERGDQMRVYVVTKDKEVLAVFDDVEKAFEYGEFYEARHHYRGLEITARIINKA